MAQMSVCFGRSLISPPTSDSDTWSFDSSTFGLSELHQNYIRHAVVKYPELSPAKYCSIVATCRNYFFRISCAEVKDYEEFKNDALVAISTKETLRRRHHGDTMSLYAFHVTLQKLTIMIMYDYVVVVYLSIHVYYRVLHWTIYIYIRTITVSTSRWYVHTYHISL